MPIVQTLHKGRVPVHIYTDDVDHAALQQLLNIANLPIVHPHVAAMPDVHAGIGATVGSVIPTRSAIIPAAYKDIDKVMAHQSDQVEVVHTLRQVICIKG